MNGVHLQVISSKMQGTESTRDNRFIVRAGIPLTEVEDESCTDEHFEKHDERNAYIRVELLNRPKNG